MSVLSIVLLSGSLLLGTGSIVAWLRHRIGLAMALLMGAAFLLRLFMAQLDPFLHDWDERFHALVAKNMMTHPFTPMLRADPVLPYDYKAWSGNHIWLHKQPLFLWQMALSLRLFGVNELALRLPSALLGSLVLYPVYRLGVLIFDRDTGYLGAVLVAFAYYALEQVSGAIGMDHNDVAFMCYVTGSIWAYYEYRHSRHPWRWLVLVGVLAGAAVLCKWLTGLVVYAGWGLASLLPSPRPWAEWTRLAASVLVALLVALPWQLYTAWRFPLESSYERGYNTRHFNEALEGHVHLWNYHFEMLPIHYGGTVLVLVLSGMVTAVFSPRRREVAPLLAIIALLMSFFTLAATKMYSYIYVLSPMLLLLAAVPLAEGAYWLRQRIGAWAAPPLALALAGLVLLSARPKEILGHHFEEQYDLFFQNPMNRDVRVANAAIARHLDNEVPVGYVVFNALAGEEMQAMFYSNRSVYAWWPSEAEWELVRRRTRGQAVFPNHHNQVPPDYVRRTPGLLELWELPR